MSLKKIIIFAVLVGMLTMGLSLVSAQDNDSDGHGATSGLILEYTGLTRTELREAIQNGATLTELIEANGQSVDAFIADAIAAFEERLDEAVANGRIDEETAAERLATFTENINNLDEFPSGNGGRGNRGEGRSGAGSELILEYTGLTREELRDALQNGSTIEELIVANGQSVDAFVADATAAFEERLDEAVANGRIDEETAAEMLENFSENLLSGERPNIGQRGNRGRRGR